MNRMPVRGPALAIMLGASLLLAACGGNPDPAGGRNGGELGDTDGGGGSAITVVAAVYPLAWLAEEIAPDAMHHQLAAGGGDAHDMDLLPGDRAAIQEAAVVVTLGDIGFQPQVEEALGTARGRVLSAAEVVGRDRLLATEDDHAEESGESLDPHLWFDPSLMAEVATALGDTMASVDPANAASYRERATALSAQLHDLDDELDTLLSGCRHDTAIVSHEAYAYLLEPRGLEQEGISGTAGHGEVSPRRLAELSEHIRAEGIPAVLAEPVEGRADAEALAQEAGVRLLEIDPLEAPADDGTGYLRHLRRQAETFATALDCTG